MAIVGITPEAVREYVVVSNRKDPVEQQVKWLIGPVDSLSMARMNDTYMELGVDAASGDEITPTSKNLRIFEWATDICKYGLKGWSNFRDANGNEIAFATKKVVAGGLIKEVVDPVVLSRIPLEVLQELSVEIRSVNSLSETEIKN